MAESHVDSPHGGVLSYIKLGPRARLVQQGQLRVMLSTEDKQRGNSDGRQRANSHSATPTLSERFSQEEMFVYNRLKSASKKWGAKFTEAQVEAIVANRPKTKNDLAKIEVRWIDTSEMGEAKSNVAWLSPYSKQSTNEGVLHI